MKRALDKIKIKGYKSIRNLERLELSNLNVLIGANGSGKSNFISIFRLLNQIVDENLQVFIGQAGGANRFLYLGQKQTEQIEVSLTFGDNSYSCCLVPAAGDRLIFGKEEISYHNRNYPSPRTISLGGGHRETELIEESENEPERVNIADYVIKAIRSWKVYHFHDTSATARVKQEGDINDNESLRSDASNLAAFLYFLKEKQQPYYRKILAIIRRVAPFFNEFTLRPNPLNDKTILLEWQELGSDAYFDANMLSDGTLRFICLATLLLQPNLPSTILIDEPELGLHPYAIQLLVGMLRSASVQTQVIVSTQSVPLVNQLTPEDIIVVDRENNQSTFRRLDGKELENWLEDYGLGDLWEKNLLGGRPG